METAKTAIQAADVAGWMQRALDHRMRHGDGGHVNPDPLGRDFRQIVRISAPTAEQPGEFEMVGSDGSVFIAGVRRKES